MKHYPTYIFTVSPIRILFLWILLFCHEAAMSQPIISDFSSLTNTPSSSYIDNLAYCWSSAIILTGADYATGQVQAQYKLPIRDFPINRVVNSKVLGITTPDDVMVATSQSICANGSVWLWASGGTEYNWSPADGLTYTYGNSIMASPSTTTTYTVAITVGDSCIVERQVTITVLPDRQIEFGNGRTIALCLGQTGQFGLIPDEGVSYVWSPWEGLNNRYVADPVVTALMTSATYYTVWAYDDTLGCVTSATVCVMVPQVQLAIDVLLEGAMVSDSMSWELQLQNLLPFNQPFGVEPFYYNGNETLAQYENKTDIVDWVFIELRDGISPETVINRRAALLRADGRVLDPYGPELLGFYDQFPINSFYIAVWHRNHLGVMSALPVGITGSNCIAVYDFTESDYHNFGNGAIQLSNGKYGMMVGDSQQDGIINAVDRVAVRNKTGQMGYLVEDLTLDGIVNALDRILVRYNTARISHIPSN